MTQPARQRNSMIKPMQVNTTSSPKGSIGFGTQQQVKVEMGSIPSSTSGYLSNQQLRPNSQ